MIHWVVERDVFNPEQYEQMKDAIVSKDGRTFHSVRIVPFEHVIADGMCPTTRGEPTVCYGSIGVAKVAKEHGWVPGVFEGDFSSTAYKALGKDFLNHDARVHSLSRAVQVANSMEAGTFFCKPNDDNKAFAGQVFDVRNFAGWVERMREIGYLDENDFDVVTCSVKPLAIEYRAVVVGGRIADMCIYRQWQTVMPEREWDPDVANMIYSCHDRYRPADVYVIDVAQTLEGLKVVEYNTFNSAGLYALDVATIVEAVSEYIS
jgi:hypothetical protein